jgi:hypothetical protein
MFKKILFGSALLLSAICFTACEEDEELEFESQNGFTGKWELKKIGGIDEYNNINYMSTDTICEYDNIIFTSDSTYTETYYRSINNVCTDSVVTGQYNVDSGNLIRTQSGISKVQDVFTLTDTMMELIYTDTVANPDQLIFLRYTKAQ